MSRRRLRPALAFTAALLAVSACSSPEPPPPSETQSPASSRPPAPPVQTPNAKVPAPATAAPAVLTATEPTFNLRKDPTAKRRYLSGIWLGGFTPQPLARFGAWRGAPVETATSYTSYESWDVMRDDWTIKAMAGFEGTLIFGVPVLPAKGGNSSLAAVADGKHDDTWRQIVANLQKNGRADTLVRVAPEANGSRWSSWGADAKTAEDYKAAFRRVVAVMRAAEPKLRFVFDISCGAEVVGDTNRMAPLERLYPGDDVVDVVGCDVYDENEMRFDGIPEHLGGTEKGPNVGEVLDFAKRHGKPMAIPEWGLHQQLGPGDHPEFIETMRAFLDKHAEDILFENYFSESGTDLGSGIFEKDQNPRSAQKYRELWRNR